MGKVRKRRNRRNNQFYSGLGEYYKLINERGFVVLGERLKSVMTDDQLLRLLLKMGFEEKLKSDDYKGDDFLLVLVDEEYCGDIDDQEGVNEKVYWDVEQTKESVDWEKRPFIVKLDGWFVEMLIQNQDVMRSFDLKVS